MLVKLFRVSRVRWREALLKKYDGNGRMSEMQDTVFVTILMRINNPPDLPPPTDPCRMFVHCRMVRSCMKP